MANRIVQAVYDLKDNITGKLKTISDSLRGHKTQSDSVTAGIERNNKRLSQSYASSADSIGQLKTAIIALGSVVGLAKVKDGIEAVIDTGERLDDLSKEFANVFGGLDKGAAALDQIKTIAAGVPQGFEDVAAAAIQMRKAGFDPLDGSLQALLDNQNALNQSQDQLIATIDALGKANIKGEISMKSFVSLIDAGIPVFDLLGKAMGLSEDRVRSLAESGQLGKDSIRLLIEELGKIRAGVSADELGDTDAQIRKLKDTAVQFLNEISKSGALDFFRAELKALNQEVTDAAKDGRLASLAKSISDGIVTTATAVKSAIVFVVDYSNALILLAKAYALVKVQAFLDGLAAIAAGTTKATGTVRLLSAAILAIPAVRLVVLGGTAILLAADYLKQLGDAIADNLPVTQKWKERTEELNAEILKGAERFRLAAEAAQKYADTQILSAETASRLSDSERASQSDRYDGLQRLLQLQIRYYEQLRSADALNEEGLKFLADLKVRLADVRGGYDALAQGARMAADALANQLTAGAQSLLLGLKGIDESSKVASESITALIGDFDKLNVVELGDIALALQSIGQKSDGAAEKVRDGLGASLTKLSSGDLQRFQLSATAAFDAVGRSGDQTAVVLDTTLRVAMDRLKVDASKTGAEFTKAGQEIVTAFQVVAENSQATALQIEAAFDAALGGVKTKQEAEALGAALQAAMQAGRIGAAATEEAMRKLQDRVQSLKAAADPLADSFSALGIKSKAALDAAAAAAKTAFDAIVNGARNGKAAQEDVAAAFAAYAEAVRATAVNSSAAAKQQIEDQLALQAAALGLSDTFKAAGDAAKKAGDDASAAFQGAKETVDETSDAVDRFGRTTGDASDGQDRFAQSLVRTKDAASGVIAVTSEMHQALAELTRLLQDDASLTNVSLDQAKALLEALGPLAGDAAALLTQRINELQDAANRAQEASRRMADEAAQMQDELDQLQGNEGDIEDRRHERKLADLKAEAEANGNLNTDAYRKLVELENKIHDLRMKNLRDEGRAGGGSGGSEGSSKRPNTGGDTGTAPPPAPTPTPPPAPDQPRPTGSAPTIQNIFNTVLLSGDERAVNQLGDMVSRRVDKNIREIARNSR
jgi:tape measure domain-containing protein